MQHLRRIEVLDCDKDAIGDVRNLLHSEEKIGAKQFFDVPWVKLFNEVDLVEGSNIGHVDLVELDDVGVLEHTQ